MDILPYNLLEKILLELAPDKKCIIDDFFKLKYVCKKWNNILNNLSFWNKFTNIIQIDYLTEIENDHQLKTKIYICKNLDIMYQKNIIESHVKSIIFNYYPFFYYCLEDIFGNIYNFSKIQYMEVSFRLLSMLYSKQYGEDLFYLFKKQMIGPIARGIDDKNRPFFAFKYINNAKNQLFWEIIYKNEYNEWTFMGDHNAYIGLLADNNRVLTEYSFNYILRLLFREPCGYIFNKKNIFDNEYTLYESDKLVNNISTVELYNY